MLKIAFTNAIKKDLKKYKHKKALLLELQEVVIILAAKKPISTKHRDHPFNRQLDQTQRVSYKK